MTVRVVVAGLAGALMIAVAAPAYADGDAAHGEKVFKRCAACHKIGAGEGNGIGPNLHGVVGRKAASLPDYEYSDAMKAAGVTWDEPTLDKYLTNPQADFPGVHEAPDLVVTIHPMALVKILGSLKIP